MTHGLVTQWITSKWGGSAVGRVESERPHRVPTALVGRQRLPLVGIAFRLWDIVMDPTGLVERCRAEMGDLFTIRIPFQFDLTYWVYVKNQRYAINNDRWTPGFGERL